MNKGTVVVDGLVATGAGVAMLAAFADDASEVGALFGVAAALYTISAVRGNRVVNACRDAKTEYARMESVSDYERVRAARADVDGASSAPIAASPGAPIAGAPGAPIAASPGAPGAPPPTPTGSAPPFTTRKPSPPPPAPASPPADWSEFWEEVP